MTKSEYSGDLIMGLSVEGRAMFVKEEIDHLKEIQEQIVGEYLYENKP